MKKKKVIVLSSLVGLIGLIVLLAFTLFALKDVSLDFRTSKQYITCTDEEIIESAGFKMGGSVLIHGKKEYKERIENFNPYLKVVNIETVFPSSFVVHLAERQEVYAISFDDGHYICDEELRVLRIAYDYQNTQESPILLAENGIDIEEGYKVGEYVKMRSPAIYSVLYGLNRPLGEQKALIESVTFSVEYDSAIKQNQNITTLKYFSGQTFKIINDEFGFKYKVKMMNDVYSQLFSFIGKTIIVDEQEVLLTEDNLKNCIIIINNYYDNTKYTEKDCWFDIRW